MKHIFIINPTAGSGLYIEELNKKLNALNDIEWETYTTKGAKDATAFVKSYCYIHKEPVRFYACGGDGTIKEVADGVVACPNAEMSCYPCGSGNDFVKCCGGKEAFRDLENLVHIQAQPIDLIKVGDQYSINVVNFGFDTCVAKTMINVKNKKIIGGKNAYKTGVFMALMKAMKNKGEIYVDGEKIGTGKFLLCTIANGQYVGGAFKCAPRALINDGELEVCLVECVSRFKFLKLLGPYTAGMHLEDSRFEKIITYRRAKSVRVKAPAGFAISVDGEIVETNDFVCEVLPGAIKFAAPMFANRSSSSQDNSNVCEPAKV